MQQEREDWKGHSGKDDEHTQSAPSQVSAAVTTDSAGYPGAMSKGRGFILPGLQQQTIQTEWLETTHISSFTALKAQVQKQGVGQRDTLLSAAGKQGLCQPLSQLLREGKHFGAENVK